MWAIKVIRENTALRLAWIGCVPESSVEHFNSLKFGVKIMFRPFTLSAYPPLSEFMWDKFEVITSRVRNYTSPDEAFVCVGVRSRIKFANTGKLSIGSKNRGLRPQLATSEVFDVHNRTASSPLHVFKYHQVVAIESQRAYSACIPTSTKRSY